MHEDHRHRVRKRYIESGLDSFADHNILELLLFYSIPRKDTNELAHRLISNFGSLKKVFEAGYDNLMTVDGVGENTAVLLSMLSQIQKHIINEKKKKIALPDARSVSDYLKNVFIGVKEETFFMLCLDGKDVLINCCRVGEGGADCVSIRKRQLLETAFRNSASSVILAHNHPNGIAAPSREDVAVTLELIDIFNAVGVRLADHCIYAGGEVISMASTAKFKDVFI